jgi:hypothetical protein
MWIASDVEALLDTNKSPGLLNVFDFVEDSCSENTGTREGPKVRYQIQGAKPTLPIFAREGNGGFATKGTSTSTLERDTVILPRFGALVRR